MSNKVPDESQAEQIEEPIRLARQTTEQLRFSRYPLSSAAMEDNISTDLISPRQIALYG